MRPAHGRLTVMEVTLFPFCVPSEDGSGLCLPQTQRSSRGSRDLGKNPRSQVQRWFSWISVTRVDPARGSDAGSGRS